MKYSLARHFGTANTLAPTSFSMASAFATSRFCKNHPRQNELAKNNAAAGGERDGNWIGSSG